VLTYYLSFNFKYFAINQGLYYSQTRINESKLKKIAFSWIILDIRAFRSYSSFDSGCIALLNDIIMVSINTYFCFLMKRVDTSILHDAGGQRHLEGTMTWQSTSCFSSLNNFEDNFGREAVTKGTLQQLLGLVL
jgi:hypothetical protein